MNIAKTAQVLAFLIFHPKTQERMTKLEQRLQLAACQEGMSVNELRSIVINESGGRTDLIGKHGEVGPAQIKPDGLAMYFCKKLDINLIKDNLRCAARLANIARKQCGGKPIRWLSSYNGRVCGPSGYSFRVNTILERRTSNFYSRR